MSVRPLATRDAGGLHRAGAVANFVLLLCIVSAVLLSSGLLAKAGAILLVFTLAGFSGENPWRFARSVRFVVCFAVALFLVQTLSIHTGDPFLLRPVLVTSGGLRAGGEMALRFFGILSASFLFVDVTDPDRLAHGFIRLGIPYRYGYLLILALRFVPFFRDELRSVREAQRMRGIVTSVKNPRMILHAARYTFVPVLVSAMSRVDSIAVSMKGRCFGLHTTRTTTRLERRSAWDWIAVGVGLTAVALSLLATRWRWA
jgi:energy-coupling factor transport system permease protein